MVVKRLLKMTKTCKKTEITKNYSSLFQVKIDASSRTMTAEEQIKRNSKLQLMTVRV